MMANSTPAVFTLSQSVSYTHLRLLAELCSQISPELVPVISAAAAILQDSTQPHVYLLSHIHI